MKRVCNKVLSKFPKSHDEKENKNKPRVQKGKSGNSPNEKSTCAKCRKYHLGECLVGTVLLWL